MIATRSTKSEALVNPMFHIIIDYKSREEISRKLVNCEYNQSLRHGVRQLTLDRRVSSAHIEMNCRNLRKSVVKGGTDELPKFDAWAL